MQVCTLPLVRVQGNLQKKFAYVHNKGLTWQLDFCDIPELDSKETVIKTI